MFRQVVSYRWSEGVGEPAKAAMRQAFENMRAIPELTAMNFSDDARYFEGNYDVVAVLDFPDFAAARRYVDDERHQIYVRDHASKIVGERVVVQHDWAVDDVAGLHHVTIPVTSIATSRDWYVLAFALDVIDATTVDGHLTEVTLVHPTSPIALVLRSDPQRALALSGFDAAAFTVSTVAQLAAFAQRIAAQGIEHGALTSTDRGHYVDVTDPDGIVIRLMTLLA